DALPALAIVGSGRVGRALARSAGLAGLTFDLAGRGDAVSACERAEVALLCVPDAAITDACETIAVAIPPLRFVCHVSGATGLDALAPAAARGADAFSIHPLQTIPGAEADVTGAAAAVHGA